MAESTGFSPNDLVFGHKVRGPLAVLWDEWIADEPPPNLIDYVNGFRQALCGWSIGKTKNWQNLRPE